MRPERPKREPRKRKPSPPNRVEPGWVHNAAAAALLQALARKRFDVGDITDDFLRAVPGQGEDSPEPAVLLSRILAHIGWRIPGLRRLEKRLEGTEARSGMGADLTALALQLYVRNRDIIAVLARDLRTQRASDQPNKGEAS